MEISTVDLVIYTKKAGETFFIPGSSFISAEYGRTLNAIDGAVVNFFPRDASGGQLVDFFREPTNWYDCMFEFWRTNRDGFRYLDLDTTWFMRRASIRFAGSTRSLTISGVSCNELLDRRVVLYNSQGPYSVKSGPASSVVRAYIRENFSVDVLDSSREINGLKFIVGADDGFGPVIDIEASHDSVFDVCQKACQLASSNATPTNMYFDVVRTSFETLEFRIYRHRRGKVIAEPLYMGGKSDRMAELTFDYGRERNVVILQGAGFDGKVILGTAISPALASSSPFSRREVLIRSQGIVTQNIANKRAAAMLRNYRPNWVVEGNMGPIEQSGYGSDWGWGDERTVEIDTLRIPTRIEKVNISIAAGSDNVSASYRGEATGL